MGKFDYNEFAKNLKKVRKQAGLTQENLAHALKVNVATISRFESGDIIPNIEQVSLMCDELGVYIGDLLTSSKNIVNKENSKNPFRTNRLFLYYKGVYPSTNRVAKLKFRLDIIERPDCIEVNFCDYKTNKIYLTGHLLADGNIAIFILENYKPSSERLEVTKIVVNISNNLNGLMLGELSATNGQYIPNERKCVVSKQDVDFDENILNKLKITEEEILHIKEEDSWYVDIFNKDDYEE